MATKTSKKVIAEPVEEKITTSYIHDVMSIARNKVKSPRKDMQAEGKQEIDELNERIKNQGTSYNHGWKK